MMKMAMTELNISTRANDRILKVARTIADRAASENILPDRLGSNIEPSTGISGHNLSGYLVD